MSPWISKTTKRDVKITDSRCVYCGCRQEALTLDHIIPIIAGGKQARFNLVAACWSCNQSKAAGVPDGFVVGEGGWPTVRGRYLEFIAKIRASPSPRMQLIHPIHGRMQIVLPRVCPRHGAACSR